MVLLVKVVVVVVMGGWVKKKKKEIVRVEVVNGDRGEGRRGRRGEEMGWGLEMEIER